MSETTTNKSEGPTEGPPTPDPLKTQKTLPGARAISSRVFEVAHPVCRSHGRLPSASRHLIEVLLYSVRYSSHFREDQRRTEGTLKVRRSEESTLQLSRNKLFDVSLTSLRGSRLSVRRKEKTREPSFFCRARTLLLTPPHCQNPFSLVGAPIFYSTHTIP